MSIKILRNVSCSNQPWASRLLLHGCNDFLDVELSTGRSRRAGGAHLSKSSHWVGNVPRVQFLSALHHTSRQGLSRTKSFCRAVANTLVFMGKGLRAGRLLKGCTSHLGCLLGRVVFFKRGPVSGSPNASIKRTKTGRHRKLHKIRTVSCFSWTQTTGDFQNLLLEKSEGKSGWTAKYLNSEISLKASAGFPKLQLWDYHLRDFVLFL